MIRKGGLRAGHLFVVDLENGRVLAPTARPRWRSRAAPYGEWHANGSPAPRRPAGPRSDDRAGSGAAAHAPARLRLHPGGPARPARADASGTAREPSGSMGNDLSLAVLSEHSPSLFSYFKQRFAQVTNPAIDSVRERLVMSLTHGDRPAGRSCCARRPTSRSPRRARPPGAHRHQPRAASRRTPTRAARDDPRRDLAGRGGRGRARGRARHAVRGGRATRSTTAPAADHLSDRDAGPGRVPIPSLLATSAVHHHLTRAGIRLARFDHRRVGRAARGPPHRGPDRLRRGRRQPVPDARDGAAPRGPRRYRRGRGQGARRAHRRGAAKGPAQGALEDGHLDDPAPTAARRSSRRSGSTRT